MNRTAGAITGQRRNHDAPMRQPQGRGVAPKRAPLDAKGVPDRGRDDLRTTTNEPTVLAGAGPDLACGVDVVDIERLAYHMVVAGERFLQRVFTAAERERCRGEVPLLAERFAAKEACAKALGTGIRGVGWHELEVVDGSSSGPVMCLHGRAAARAATLGFSEWRLSLSHCRAFALACVVAVRASEGR